MNQKMVGQFLKQLRREKGVTQAQLAEHLNVSGRTVSRWETGVNMPDLDLLILLADYYQVDIRELLDGERKAEPMNKETEQTMLKIADYTNSEKRSLSARLFILFCLGLATFTAYFVLDFLNLTATPIGGPAADCALGFTYGLLIAGVLYTSGLLARFKAAKKRLLQGK